MEEIMGILYLKPPRQRPIRTSPPLFPGDVQSAIPQAWCPKWEAWMKLPERCYLLPDVVYLHYRLPFENGLQFKIKFHK